MRAQNEAAAAAAAKPQARSTRAQLIHSAQVIARDVAELSELLASPLDNPVPGAIELVSRLRESVQNLSADLQRQPPPIVVDLASSIGVSELNVPSNAPN